MSIKKLWKQSEPYMKITFAVFTALITGGIFYAKAVDAIADVGELKAWRHNIDPRLERIDQKLDDIILFWRIPHRPRHGE